MDILLTKLRYRVLHFFGLTGVTVQTWDKNGRERTRDVSKVEPGMLVMPIDADKPVKVTGRMYDNGFDYMIPCADGFNYSPLVLE